MPEVLVFEGRLAARSTFGSLMTQLYVAPGVSVFDGMTVDSGMTTGMGGLGFSCIVDDATVLFDGQVGAVRVQVQTFKTGLVDPVFGANAISWRTAEYVGDVNRITSFRGSWEAFSFVQGGAWTSPLVPLPSSSDLDVYKRLDRTQWSTTGHPAFLDYVAPSTGFPSSGITVNIQTQVIGSPTNFEPMFDGTVRIYLDSYTPPVDPSSFWTSLTGTKETL